MRSVSVMKSAKRRSERPDWAVPRTSPGPRSWRSASAISKPSEVDSRMESFSMASGSLESVRRMQ